MRRLGILLAFMATLTLTAVAETACTSATATSAFTPWEQSCFQNGVCCYRESTNGAISCVATKITIEPGEINDVRPQNNGRGDYQRQDTRPSEDSREMVVDQGVSRFIPIPASAGFPFPPSGY